MMDHYILDENDNPVPIQVWREPTPEELINGTWVGPTSGEVIDHDAMLRWGKFYEQGYRRIVKQEHVGRSWVSTVFLTLDHSFGFRGDGFLAGFAKECGIEVDSEPILWETMVFGGKMNDEQNRCGGNKLNAESMHFRMVLQVREAEGWRVPVYGMWWNYVEPMIAEQIYDWHEWLSAYEKIRRAKKLKELYKFLKSK